MYGFEPKTCWIAQVKEKLGLHVRLAVNRIGENRSSLRPSKKIESIKAALKHFWMIWLYANGCKNYKVENSDFSEEGA
jgi:hypothetical protein